MPCATRASQGGSDALSARTRSMGTIYYSPLTLGLSERADAAEALRLSAAMALYRRQEASRDIPRHTISTAYFIPHLFPTLLA
jgi:hypothetical protein